MSLIILPLLFPTPQQHSTRISDKRLTVGSRRWLTEARTTCVRRVTNNRLFGARSRQNNRPASLHLEYGTAYLSTELHLKTRLFSHLTSSFKLVIVTCPWSFGKLLNGRLNLSCIIMLLPQYGGCIKRWCASDVCLSVAYIGPKSRTERPRKIEIGTEVAHATRDSRHHFQGQKVKGQLAWGGSILWWTPAQLIIIIRVI